MEFKKKINKKKRREGQCTVIKGKVGDDFTSHEVFVFRSRAEDLAVMSHVAPVFPVRRPPRDL